MFSWSVPGAYGSPVHWVAAHVMSPGIERSNGRTKPIFCGAGRPVSAGRRRSRRLRAPSTKVPRPSAESATVSFSTRTGMRSTPGALSAGTVVSAVMRNVVAPPVAVVRRKYWAGMYGPSCR
ncbi:hypothetical protein [Corynebacterium bovis]|uniref:hypothetical protein n=1 Tax=Corynebacterium bovis TaxID=36808 RepID=UPI000F64591C|nr:hypothetical protein [Corynebacterium bovis]RRO80121.1 hypothetical protein CXF38_07480 [Corynebacterium bovis]